MFLMLLQCLNNSKNRYKKQKAPEGALNSILVAARLSVSQDGQGAGLGHLWRPHKNVSENKFSRVYCRPNCHRQFSPATF